MFLIDRLSGYKFSNTSELRLSTVHEDLQKVIHYALSISKVDFGVAQGIRTLEEQKELFEQGKSMTMDSRHLNGLAIDLYAWFDGQSHWDVESNKYVFYAIKEAARKFDVKIRWGGCWQDLDNIQNPIESVEQYKELRISQGRVPFVDAPHYELSREYY